MLLARSRHVAERDQTRARADRHRASWLDGYRGVLGLAYLTLVPVD